MCGQCGGPTFPQDLVRPDGTLYSGVILEQDRYRVLRRLGHGGMGTVYQGFDRILGRLVAIKFIGVDQDLVVDRPLAERMVREAMATARIENPHVVRFVDLGRTAQNVPFLVMELLQGSDLKDWLASRNGRHVPADQAIEIAHQICKALEAAHSRGFVHRDLKPANVFLEEHSDGNLFVKVLDFGLARGALEGHPDDSLTVKGIVLGTPEYMAPELAKGVMASPASDLYSLGLILWEMLAGHRPHKGEPLVLMVRRSTEPVPGIPDGLGVPAGLADLVYRLMDPDPSRRPGSAHAVSLELDDLKGGTERTQSVSKRPADTWPQFPDTPSLPPRPQMEVPRMTSFNWKTGAVLIIGLLLAVAAGWWLWDTMSTSRIAEVKAVCGQRDVDVTVAARVSKTINVPLTDISVYKISDRSDSMWVFSTRSSPPEGARLRVRGSPYDAKSIDRDCTAADLDPTICKGLSTAIRLVAGSCILMEDERW